MLRGALATLCPGAQVKSYLMMPDKSAKAAVGGLNQLFKIERANGRSKVTASASAKQVAQQLASTPGTLPLLALVPVDEYVDRVMQHGVHYMSFKAPLPQLATQWAEAYKHDHKIPPMPGKHCGKCEFKTRPGDGLLSGFEECWHQAYSLTPSQLPEGTVLDIYNFRRKDQLISAGTVLLSQASHAMEVVDARPELSLSERQWMQVKGIPSDEDRGGYWLADGVMRQAMRTWRYPYHFIDFETSTVAIPFHKGMRPYEPVAFQFSHHVMQADGSVAHVDEFLLTDPVVFPNFEFARALKRALEGDEGSVFMWSSHENTILNKIVGQLEGCLEGAVYGSGDGSSSEGGAPDDALELIEFMRTLISGGSRAMVDLCVLSRKAYFAEGIKGSSSIKKVLPSVMKWSGVLKSLYSGNVYGGEGLVGQGAGVKQAVIPSKNFKNFAWWVPSDADPSVPLEPYDLLRLEAEDLLGEEVRAGEDPDVMAITEGGAAATAYARLQFEDVDEVERRMIREALLRYCELDTLAMVMIVQAWQEAV